eukprot:78753_1
MTGIYLVNKINVFMEFFKLRRVFYSNDSINTSINYYMRCLFEELTDINPLAEYFKGVDEHKQNEFWQRIIFCQKREVCIKLQHKTSVKDICQIIKKYGSKKLQKLDESECFCLYLKLKHQHKRNDISKIILSSFDDSELKQVICSKQVDSVDFINYISHFNDPSQSLRKILDCLYDTLDLFDSVKIQLAHNILPKINHQCFIDAKSIFEAALQSQIDITINNSVKGNIDTNQHLTIHNDLFFYVYLNKLFKSNKQHLCEILPELYVLGKQNKTINVNAKKYLNLILHDNYKSNGRGKLCDISTMYNNIVTPYKEKIYFDAKRKHYHNIRDSSYELQIEGTVFCYIMQTILNNTKTKQENAFLMVWTKMRHSDFYDALFTFYDRIYESDQFNEEDEKQQYETKYLLPMQPIIDVTFNKDNEEKDLSTIIQNMYDESKNVMLEFDFIRKKQLYLNLLKNRTDTNANITIESFERVIDKVIQYDKDNGLLFPDVMLSCSLYTKIKSVKIQNDDIIKNFTFPEIFTKLLTEQNNSFYVPNKQQVCIQFEGLKDVIFRQFPDTDQINVILNRVFNAAQHHMNEMFCDYFSDIDANKTNEFWKRIIFWQKLHFKNRIKLKKISIHNICSTMSQFKIFDKNSINSEYFMNIKMKMNESNHDCFIVSLQELYKV